MSHVTIERPDLSEPVFRIAGDTAIATAHAGGPWDASLQHGAAPASLIAWACERLPAAAPMRVARMTIDLMRPVPIAPLTIRSRVVRDGRKIQLCEILLSADETEIVRASILKIRAATVALPSNAASPSLDLLPPESGREPTEIGDIRNPFLTGIAMRVVKGAFRSPGPATVWFRSDRPIIDGEKTSGLMRAAITADFSNGTSAVLDFGAWTFINGDLTLSLARGPVGEWILLDAETWLAPNGGGLALARPADTTGYFGTAVQSLIVERVKG